MEQIYTPKQDYKVLVTCMTYNQSKFIEDALNGFAMQQTKFPFVCLVVDDCSTDGEQELIKTWMEYECDMERAESVEIELSIVTIAPHKSNANCFFAFYLLKQNLYGTGKKLPLITPWRNHCEYEAMCEGDDYWTHPEKLQKQVDILDKYPKVSCVVTDYMEYIQNSGEFRNPNLHCLRGFSGEGMVKDLKYYSKCIFFTKTLTAMYRVSAYKNCKISKYAVSFDMMLFYALATQGDIYLMNEKMGVYRINEGSTVSSINVDKFNRNVLPKLFSICEVEQTKYAQDFIYNYMKPHVFWMLRDNCWYISKYYHYLGWFNATKLLTKDLGFILCDIAKYKLKKLVGHIF